MNREIFDRGIVEILDKESFEKKLKSGKKLRIKLGADPTRPDLHLGHAVSLNKLKQLQDEGHKIVFVIGDYTARIGDPSGRNSARPILLEKDIKKNAKTYFKQVGKILNLKKTEIRYNSEWFSKMSFSEILSLCGKFTVAQITERDDFQNRLKEGIDVGLFELLYPVMQAYDSVMLRSDVEFGGTDQKFNMLAGRDLQKKMNMTPQDVVMVSLLTGLDGKMKMSKSSDNYVGITDDKNEMFGKIMSIPDESILEYFGLLTELKTDEIEEIKSKMEAGENPKDFKIRLACEIVKIYHGNKEAEEAKREFENVFSKGSMPKDIPIIAVSFGDYPVSTLLVNLGAIPTTTQARRLIVQGAVKIDGVKISDPEAIIGVNSGMIISIGKLRYFQIK